MTIFSKNVLLSSVLLSLFQRDTFTTYKFKLFRPSCKLCSLNTKTIYNGIQSGFGENLLEGRGGGNIWRYQRTLQCNCYMPDNSCSKPTKILVDFYFDHCLALSVPESLLLFNIVQIGFVKVVTYTFLSCWMDGFVKIDK